MTRWLLLIAAAALSSAQTGMRDRYFTRYPFDRWVSDGERAQIRWLVKIGAPNLTAHQRLSARVEIEVDAKEIARRRGRGEIVTFLQIEDSSQHRWRVHNSYNLAAIPDKVKTHAVAYTQELFILPGDYVVSLAACDSTTHEYSFTRRTLHVAPLRGDPLPAAWLDLQPVEFVHRFDMPDVWFQPYIRGRLRLPLQTSRPVHLDLVMNMTPSDRISGSVRAFRRNMSVLVPALKMLSGVELSQGSIDVALLDLTRRRTWEQKNARGLDWNRMRAPFADADPGVIDAQSLAARGQMTQFFRDQLLARLRPAQEADGVHVMIVLSAPVFLEHQLKVEQQAIPRDPNRRIFYLRYRPTPVRNPSFGPFREVPVPAASALPSDDIERTLKSLDARIYNAITPEEFRKVVSSVMNEVEKM